MKSRFVHGLLWTVVVLSCTVILGITHTLKWPGEDLYDEADRAASQIRQAVNNDSVLYVHVATGIPEDLYLYLRYALIPIRVELQAKHPKGPELLLANRNVMDSNERILLAKRPEASIVMRYIDSTIACHVYKY